MKKILLSIVLLILVPLQACAQVKLWEEGVHYTIIADKATETPIVREYFSFWCPACFTFEPLVKQLKTQLPEDAKFEQIHVNFMGFRGITKEIQDSATQAMFIAKQLDKEEQLMGAIFNYFHPQNQRFTITGLNDFRNLYVVNGVDPEAFDKHAKSFAVRSLVNKNNKQVMAKRQHVGAVPAFVVNGKFKVNQQSLTSAQDFYQLINWLINQS